MILGADIKELIATFPLGFVATVRSDGTPAVSPKGTFIVLDDKTIAYGDIRSPGTRRNLAEKPAAEVNFIDPFRRIAARVSGTATLHPKGSDWFMTQHPQWASGFGDLAKRITTLVEITVNSASLIKTPPYDGDVTEDEMINLYKAKFAEIYP